LALGSNAMLAFFVNKHFIEDKNENDKNWKLAIRFKWNI
jgi:hypothetical protein